FFKTVKVILVTFLHGRRLSTDTRTFHALKNTREQQHRIRLFFAMAIEYSRCPPRVPASPPSPTAKTTHGRRKRHNAHEAAVLARQSSGASDSPRTRLDIPVHYLLRRQDFQGPRSGPDGCRAPSTPSPCRLHRVSLRCCNAAVPAR